MPNVPISCLPPSRVDPEVQGLKVIIDCPQPGSSQASYRPTPIRRWSKCSGNDTVMVAIYMLTGSKRKKEDTFGLNDDDWDVYKQIVSLPHICH